MALQRVSELRPIADEADPDDWRPDSRWALLADAATDMAVVVEEIAVGDAIPLHRHRIDEVILFASGNAEARVGDATYDVGGGDVLFVPAGTVHGTRNAGADVVRIQAVFPSARIDIEYVERNAAPGTESAPPGSPIVVDARSGAVERLAGVGA